MPDAGLRSLTVAARPVRPELNGLALRTPAFPLPSLSTEKALACHHVEMGEKSLFPASRRGTMQFPVSRPVTLAQLYQRAHPAGRWPRAQGDGFSCRCPAHADRLSFLSVSLDRQGAILFHCSDNCDYAAIAAAFGYEAGELEGSADQAAACVGADAGTDGPAADRVDPDRLIAECLNAERLNTGGPPAVPPAGGGERSERRERSEGSPVPFLPLIRFFRPFPARRPPDQRPGDTPRGKASWRTRTRMRRGTRTSRRTTRATRPG